MALLFLRFVFFQLKKKKKKKKKKKYFRALHIAHIYISASSSFTSNSRFFSPPHHHHHHRRARARQQQQSGRQSGRRQNRIKSSWRNTIRTSSCAGRCPASPSDVCAKSATGNASCAIPTSALQRSSESATNVTMDRTKGDA